MKLFIQYLSIATIFVSFTGCTQSISNAVNKAQIYMDKKIESYKNEETVATKTINKEIIKPIKKAKGIYFFTKKISQNIFKKEKKTKANKYFIRDLLDLNAIVKDSNSYKFNTLDKISESQVFDSISHTKDGFIAVSKTLKSSPKGKASMILYYTKEHKFNKVVLFIKPTGKLTLSDDGQMMFARNSKEVIDLNSFKTIQKFTKEELNNSKYTYKLSNFRFSKYNTYLMYNKMNHYKGIYSHETLIQKVINKKVIHSAGWIKFENKTDKISTIISPNEKYSTEDYLDKVNFGYGNNNAFILYPLLSEKPIKTFYNNRSGDNKLNRAWNDNKLFYHYKKNSKSKTGIYDIQTDKIYCKDIGKFENIKEIIWTKQDNHIYMINNSSVYPIIFKDNKCIQMSGYPHKIDKLKDNKYNTRFISDDKKVTLYSQDKFRTQISTIKLKKYTQKDFDSLNNIKVINKLLNNGFEKRAFKLIDKEIQLNTKFPYYEITPKNSSTLYQAYIVSKMLEKELTIPDDNQNIVHALKNGYIQGAIFSGYSYLLPSVEKKLNELIMVKEYDNKTNEVIRELSAVVRATYLLSINKDDEAYDILFTQQPFFAFNKGLIKTLTYLNTPLAKNKGKLSVSTAIDKKDFFTPPKSKLIQADFFFDIDGNKVFKDAQKNKLVPKKQKVKKIKKTDAIEFLD